MCAFVIDWMQVSCVFPITFSLFHTLSNDFRNPRVPSDGSRLLKLLYFPCTVLHQKSRTTYRMLWHPGKPVSARSPRPLASANKYLRKKTPSLLPCEAFAPPKSIVMDILCQSGSPKEKLPQGLATTYIPLGLPAKPCF